MIEWQFSLRRLMAFTALDAQAGTPFVAPFSLRHFLCDFAPLRDTNTSASLRVKSSR
jgi:hypothetical protein